MKHATAATLDRLEPLLESIRGIGGLKEKSRGCFYRGSKSFLHFHEDPEGLFADVREWDDFRRLPVNTAPQREALISMVQSLLEIK